MTPEAQGKIVEAIGKGIPRKFAAQMANVTPRCFQLWMAAGRKATSGDQFRFFRLVEEAEAKSVANKVRRIDRHGRQSWAALAWLLEKMHPREFGAYADRIKALEKEVEEIRRDARRPGPTGAGPVEGTGAPPEQPPP